MSDVLSNSVDLSKPPKVLRVLYVTNIVLIAIVFGLTLIAAINMSEPGESFWEGLTLVYFLFNALFSWPVFVVFLGLNIWYAIADRSRRGRFAIFAIVMLLYNAMMLYVIIDWYSMGAPMP